MGVVSNDNKSKKKTYLSLGAGEGGEGKEERVCERKKCGQCSCCLWRCGDAAPRHHNMTTFGLATKALLAQLVTTLVTCLVISIKCARV